MICLVTFDGVHDESSLASNIDATADMVIACIAVAIIVVAHVVVSIVPGACTSADIITHARRAIQPADTNA